MGAIDFSDGRFWLDLVQSVVMLGLFVFVWLRKPGEDAKKQLAAIEQQTGERLVSLETDVKVIKERMVHIPSKEELAELEGRLATLLAHIDGLRVAVDITRGSVARIEDFLRSRT
jgi:hypothetical protein